MQREIVTVSEINSYIKRILGQDTRLSSVLVRGEISNFTRHSSGHLYFSLKDKTGTIKCVMFRGNAQRLQFEPGHGMEVLIGGYVAVYERDGVYQLYVKKPFDSVVLYGFSKGMSVVKINELLYKYDLETL